jgi:2-polyprenyl-6-methoxyphenol hydroxylase-like FAD-dependent oxidoreductase
VVVVGARVAGATLAMLLARAGLDVVVVERAARGADTLSTHALMRPAVRQLAQWGVLPSIVAAGTPAITRTVFNYGDLVVPVDLAPNEPLYAPRRTVIDPLLAEAGEAAGAAIRFETRVLDVTTNGGGRVDGVIVDRGGSQERIGARLVVGADGIRSLIARKVEAPVTHRARHAAAAIGQYVDTLSDPSSYRWYFARTASAGAIPTNGGAVVFAAGPQEEFRREVAADVAAGMRRWLLEAAPDLAEEMVGATPRSRLRSFPGERSFMRQAAGPGWALVGDAGVFTDPMTAHGMTSALRDADLAARAAWSALAGLESEAAAWGRYEQERDRFARPLIDAIDEVVAYRHDLAHVQEAHLALSRVMQAEYRALDEVAPFSLAA